MRTKLISPADYVIHCFGGVRATARHLKRSPSSICRWKRKGKIPTSIQYLLLLKAKQLKLDIEPIDLIEGRKISLERAS